MKIVINNMFFIKDFKKFIKPSASIALCFDNSSQYTNFEIITIDNTDKYDNCIGYEVNTNEYGFLIRAIKPCNID